MINKAAVLLAAYRLGVQHGGSSELSGAGQSDEKGQPALTDAERECMEWAEEIAGNCEEFDRAATLRGLLERLG